MTQFAVDHGAIKWGDVTLGGSLSLISECRSRWCSRAYGGELRRRWGHQRLLADSDVKEVVVVIGGDDGPKLHQYTTGRRAQLLISRRNPQALRDDDAIVHSTI